ncbi:transglycosylase SLT domain-containing protein [Albidovulum sediminicola]|uniref:Transglycosylase SLT domain-containing protein n=1 Tax=Albidovulum sediminicola TaxID=2984331 RepID=A0ABT2YXP9_9RHOB|nr:transglycosylase SLT domain-containing protein [Defluviimonas sp. WL0075]MCV2863654.1 transglycosylase SLT domain-containing protein [Defluviimonas sp. WL0075]
MPKALGLVAAAAALSMLTGCVTPQSTMGAMQLPPMRWDHLPEGEEWTVSTLRALSDDGAALAETVPQDIDTFCPGYSTAGPEDRRAFWAGLLSALAKHESTWNPEARGGGGRWIGLLQIAPRTARAYDCDASDREGLQDGSANLACAVRIAATQVARDDAIVSDGSGGWRGIARDWAPMRASSKRDDIAAWTRSQSYCQ